MASRSALAVRMNRSVFISYRRDDAPGHAGRIRDRLERELGPNLVYIDVDSIDLGADFAQAIRDAIAKL
jgi:TIR domain